MNKIIGFLLIVIPVAGAFVLGWKFVIAKCPLFVALGFISLMAGIYIISRKKEKN